LRRPRQSDGSLGALSPAQEEQDFALEPTMRMMPPDWEQLQRPQRNDGVPEALHPAPEEQVLVLELPLFAQELQLFALELRLFVPELQAMPSPKLNRPRWEAS